MMNIRAFLLSVCLLAGGTLFAQVDGRTIEYDGNIITVEKVVADTVLVIDPETGEEVILVRKAERFALLNGNPIYQRKEAEQPIGSASQAGFSGFVEKLLEDEIRSNRNSFNYIELIIDEKGEIAYFKTRFTDSDGKPMEKSAVTSDMFIKLGDAKIKPARKDGVAVPYYIKIE